VHALPFTTQGGHSAICLANASAVSSGSSGPKERMSRMPVPFASAVAVAGEIVFRPHIRMLVKLGPDMAAAASGVIDSRLCMEKPWRLATIAAPASGESSVSPMSIQR